MPINLLLKVREAAPSSFTCLFSAGGTGSQLLGININSLACLENCVHRSPAGTEAERSRDRGPRTEKEGIGGALSRSPPTVLSLGRVGGCHQDVQGDPFTGTQSLPIHRTVLNAQKSLKRQCVHIHSFIYS